MRRASSSFSTARVPTRSWAATTSSWRRRCVRASGLPTPPRSPLAWAFARHLGGPRTILDNGHRYLRRFGRGPDPDGVDPGDTGHGGHAHRAVRVSGLAMRLADVERWSLPNLLTYVDRSAMAFGIETRLPFLDPDVVALALAMPAKVLVHDGWSKWPLRQTLSDLDGATPAWRRGKRWFGVPQRAWLRGPLAPCVEEWRRDPHPLWADLVDMTAMRAVRGHGRNGAGRARRWTTRSSNWWPSTGSSGPGSAG